MIAVTRAEAISAIKDMVNGEGFRTDRIVAWLEQHGATFALDADAPCPHCGKPWDTKSCAIGGCPLGADL